MMYDSRIWVYQIPSSSRIKFISTKEPTTVGSLLLLTVVHNVNCHGGNGAIYLATGDSCGLHLVPLYGERPVSRCTMGKICGSYSHLRVLSHHRWGLQPPGHCHQHCLNMVGPQWHATKCAKKQKKWLYHCQRNTCWRTSHQSQSAVAS